MLMRPVSAIAVFTRSKIFRFIESDINFLSCYERSAKIISPAKLPDARQFRRAVAVRSVFRKRKRREEGLLDRPLGVRLLHPRESLILPPPMWMCIHIIVPGSV